MIAGFMAAARAMYASGAVTVARSIKLSKTKGLILKGVAEYTKGNMTEIEELRLARQFQRYLKIYLREQIFKKTKNAPFTELMKGFNHPLVNTSALTDKYVYIRKLSRGYRVGFKVWETLPNGMNLGRVLEVLENGALLNQDPDDTRKMRAWIWINIRSKLGKRKESELGDIKTSKKYKIPPRPFFNRIVDSFILHNKGERREYTKGSYYLIIVVRKPKVTLKEAQNAAKKAKKAKSVFTELYG